MNQILPYLFRHLTLNLVLSAIDLVPNINQLIVPLTLTQSHQLWGYTCRDIKVDKHLPTNGFDACGGIISIVNINIIKLCFINTAMVI